MNSLAAGARASAARFWLWGVSNNLEVSDGVGAGPRASPMSREGHSRLTINPRKLPLLGASGWHGACPYTGLLHAVFWVHHIEHPISVIGVGSSFPCRRPPAVGADSPLPQPLPLQGRGERRMFVCYYVFQICSFVIMSSQSR